MPVYLRKFYFTKLNDYKTKENEEIKKVQQKKPTIAKPPFANPRINR